MAVLFIKIISYELSFPLPSKRKHCWQWTGLIKMFFWTRQQKSLWACLENSLADIWNQQIRFYLSEHWFENGFITRSSCAGWNEYWPEQEQPWTSSLTAGARGVWILHIKVIRAQETRSETGIIPDAEHGRQGGEDIAPLASKSCTEHSKDSNTCKAFTNFHSLSPSVSPRRMTDMGGFYIPRWNEEL